MNLTEYYTLFGTGPDEARGYLATALSKGGGYADLYFQHTFRNDLTIMDGKVNRTNASIEYGVGIRVVSGEKTGYAFTESLLPDDIRKAALSAAEIAAFPSHTDIPPFRIPGGESPGRYPVLFPWEEHSVEEKKHYLLLTDALIREKDSRTVNVTGRMSDSTSRILFFNSEGDCYADERPYASLGAMCIMAENGRRETFYGNRSFMKGFEFLNEELVRNVVTQVTEGCARLFTAKRPPCGEMPVVMGSGSSGILLHEAIGHTFEADFNRKKESIFCDRMGQKICSEEISIVDDGTIPGNRGAVNFDDEGIPGQKTWMVRNGILESYLHDRISAAHYHVAPTGNGRRESFRFMPIPRMRATYMENGNSTEAELIASVKKGIFVDNFSNGQVQIGAGDFTFYVKSGYLIENGRLTAPIKDANIIGNGPEALACITGVAGNLSVDDSTWTCGKGQYCPVSCGMPSVLVAKLNVGGINE